VEKLRHYTKRRCLATHVKRELLPFATEPRDELYPRPMYQHGRVDAYCLQADKVEVRCIEEQRAQQLDQQRPFRDVSIHRLINI
jgi:hypothetical protein